MLSARMINRKLCAGLTSIVLVAGAMAQPTVSISPAAVTINPGESVTLNVLVSSITPEHPLHAANITVAFDGAVLQLNSSAAGTFLSSMGGSVFTPSPLITSNSVTYNQAILGGGSDVTGSGILFSLTFTGLSRGTSAITVTSVDLREFIPPDGQASIASLSQNGSVVVGTTVGNIKAFLQGPFSSGIMGIALRTAGYVPVAHPYGVSPWLYTGTESVTAIPALVVDWVLIELRTGPAAATLTARRAAFIQSDGSIVDVDGTSPVSFPASVTAGSYYVVVRHRNHLAAMSATPVALSATSGLYDFTTGLDKYYGGDAKELAAGVYGLWSGDVTGNGQVKYSGSSNDRSPILTRIGGSDLTLSVNGYYPEDVNMNGQVKYSGSSNDRSLILLNIGGSDMTVTRSTRVPN